MKLLPIGMQTFSQIIENNYIYVDKTKDIYNVVSTGKIYFLSRPRRFGKSLLLSTLESLFKGEKELFEGLYIYDKWDWEDKYSVILLDMTEVNSETGEKLKKTLKELINNMAKKNNIALKNTEYNTMFYELIEEVYNITNKNVVVLVDEYDAPLIDNLANEDVLNDVKEVMNNFYKILKSKNEYLRFVFLTGVSKFSGVSVFSGLNSPDDISLNKDFTTICGYTQEDLEFYFREYIDKVALECGYSYDECLLEIDLYYDGYSWDGVNNVYNPYSTLKLFRERSFENYWYATGVTTALMKTIKRLVLEKSDFNNLFNVVGMDRISLMDFNSLYDDMTPLLFQTGYLTVKVTNKKFGSVRYSLDFPNHEVEESFYLNLLSEITKISRSQIKHINNKLKDYIITADEENMRLELKAMAANIPNLIHVHSHNYYQSAILSWLFGAGFKPIGEYNIAKGRMNAILMIEETVIIVELKFEDEKPLKKLLDLGLSQIHDNKYYEPYVKDYKVNFLSIAVSDKVIDCKFEKYKT